MDAPDGSIDGTAKFDLSLVLLEKGGGLQGNFEIRKGLFSPGKANRLVTHFVAILQAMVDTPKLGIWDVPLIDEETVLQAILHAETPEDIVHHCTELAGKPVRELELHVVQSVDSASATPVGVDGELAYTAAGGTFGATGFRARIDEEGAIRVRGTSQGFVWKNGVFVIAPPNRFRARIIGQCLRNPFNKGWKSPGWRARSRLHRAGAGWRSVTSSGIRLLHS